MATIDLGRLGFVNKGTYNNSTTYEKNDLVQFTDGGILSTYLYIDSTAQSGQAPSSSGTAGSRWVFFAKGVADAVASAGNNKVLVTNASGNLTPLSIGSAGHFLRTNAGANGFEFAEAGGGLVQTVYATNTTAYQQGGSTYGTGSNVLVSGSITPTSASNKIIVIGSAHGSQINHNAGGTVRDSLYQISRDISGGSSGTQLVESRQRFERNVGNDDMPIMAHQIAYDTNYNTTSALTYNFQTKGVGGGWDSFWQQSGSASMLLMMEVKV